MAADETNELCDKAWEARYSQDFEACHGYLAELKQQLRFPFGVLSSESLLLHFQSLEVQGERKELHANLQALLLTASLARSEEGIERAEAYLSWAQEICHRTELRNIFEFHFQAALNFSARGDFSSALEAFVISRLATSKPPLKAMALFNSYACLIHLGICYKKTFAELNEVLNEAQTLGAPKYLLNIIDQVSMAQAKEVFYRGEFSQALERFSQLGFGQLDYFKLWLKALPYNSSYDGLESLNLEPLVLADPHFYQKSYRLRTLQGLLHPADLENSVPQEQIDRIYLWTWRWLIKPESFPISKILALLSPLDFSKLHKSCTQEDHQLLHNALSWLALFSPGSARELTPLLERVNSTVTKSSFLSFEADCIRALLLLRDQRASEFLELHADIKANPLWASTEQQLSQLIEAVTVEKAAPLPKVFSATIDNIKGLLNRPSAKLPQTSKNLVIDLGLGQIHSVKLKKALQSEVMACAFHLLYQKGSVNCEEFLENCFGIGGFDAFIHEPKIYNLLARMRALKVPDLKMGVKAGKVYAVGSWAHIEFIKARGSEHELDHRVEWRGFVASRKSQQKSTDEVSRSEHWVRPKLILRQLAELKHSESARAENLLPQEFTRSEIEHVAKVSRATANRILKSWREKGLIGERGQARSKVYYLKNQSL